MFRIPKINLIYYELSDLRDMTALEEAQMKDLRKEIDILIIDEILSVGDFTFQKKCHKKMQELTQQGATVLFVSHSASDIINMCDRAVWLDHGRLIEEGQAQYLVEKYMNQ